MGKFVVEVCDDPSELQRGYIGEASEDDPMGTKGRREFDDLDEVREAIQRVIDSEGPTVSFGIEPVEAGGDFGCVYWGGSEWKWELPGDFG